MSNETIEQITQWMAEEWGRAFINVMETMADQKPSTACDGTSRPFTPTEGALCWEQEFSLGPQAILRISVPQSVWNEAGARVLRTAGIDEVSPDDARSTFHEILSQIHSLVAQAFSTRVGHEVTCGSSSDRESLPDDATGLSLAITIPDTAVTDAPIFLSPAPELVEFLQQSEASEARGSEPKPKAQASNPPSSISKTFDLLLGVHLPVSVSFGKTSMMVKEVLKLTTGSIVELNRAVTEPVDIIVNNCVIARGEVVVVAGNYGVRVREIVSKEQRYETGVRSASIAPR